MESNGLEKGIDVGSDILKQALEKTNSEVIIALVVVGVILLIGFGIFVWLQLRAEGKRDEREDKRNSETKELQTRTLDIIQGVTETLTALKVVIEANTSQHTETYARFFGKLEENNTLIREAANTINAVLVEVKKKPRAKPPDKKGE